MKNDVVIKVEKISKKYQIGKRESYLTLRDRLVELPQKIFKKEKKREFWALKNVSFEIKRGEVVGVIGRNGAGKSTLLKILARITEPTSGKITMKGRVASMLEVGTGFNPELTGRENIYLNGSILGMSRSEIESKFKEIVEFSGVDKFLDTPVKHYSSGMYVRLAFAVAAHLDSDILLVDEVLAVGDTEFQKKCLGKMSDLASTGRTVIFVSHNMGAIKRLCQRIILLQYGQKNPEGTINASVDRYMETTTIKNNFHPILIPEIKVKLTKISIHGDKQRKVIPGKPTVIDIEIESPKKVTDIGIQLTISHNDVDGRVFSTNSKVIKNMDLILNKGKNHFQVQIKNFNLCSGKYWLGFGMDRPFEKFYYLETELLYFKVEETRLPDSLVPTLPDYGHVYLNHEWIVNDK